MAATASVAARKVAACRMNARSKPSTVSLHGISYALLRQVRSLARAAIRSRYKEDICLYLAGVTDRCKAGRSLEPHATELRRQLGELDVDSRHYLASTFFALTMGSKTRKRLAAFFTPPGIAQHVVTIALASGLDLRKHSIIDPAAGGAAFLSTLAGRMRAAECQPREAQSRLVGLELNPALARIATRLVSHRLGDDAMTGLVRAGDALAQWEGALVGKFHAVLANPPYGRLTGSEAKLHAKRSEVVSAGHVNRYALFAGLATRLARPGGIVVLVLPASFLTGPLFKRLRRYFRTECRIQAVDLISHRVGTFLDVQQDACVLTLIKKPIREKNAPQGRVEFSTLSPAGTQIGLGDIELPIEGADPWLAPETALQRVAANGKTLGELGVDVRSGYFVWNRERDRIVARHSNMTTVPLIWANNVKPRKAYCRPRGRGKSKLDFVTFSDLNHRSIIRRSALVVQRTTNSRQPRRLLVGLVPASVPRIYSGYVTENHTLVLVPKQGTRTNLRLLNKLLNTQAVDEQLRRLLTGSHVSVEALRQLRLPSLGHFATLLKRRFDPDTAARIAYQLQDGASPAGNAHAVESLQSIS